MKIIGHKKQWRFLKQSAEQEKISHAYLFCGEAKLGKRTIALKWISLITGCSSQKQNPDLIFVRPEKKTIQISQIRELIWKLQLTPSLSPLKTAIIDQADSMGIEAQHALLKTLEEPKGKAVLILITAKPEVLFPTIRSRCEIIKFYPVQKSEIKDYLKKQGLSESESELIASISRGRPGEAIDFILNPQKLRNRRKIIKEFEEILNSPLYLRFQYARNLSQKENLREILEIWLTFLRNALFCQLNLQPCRVSLENYSLKKLKNSLEFLEKINFLLSTTNLNPKLALETFLIEA